MIEDFVRVIMKQVSEKYPHIEHPAVMRARITSVRKLSNEYEEKYKLKLADGGEEKEYIIKGNYYSYGLAIMDAAGTLLSNFPAIPNVESRLQLKGGDAVTVVFVGSETAPVIVGG